MKKEISELQKKMFEEGMDVYYIPSSDFHGSEYMHPYFRCREYLSGFDGSAGDMVVTASDALLWTDSRYFIQAEQQLEGSGVKLMKMGEDGVPTIKEFISELAESFIKDNKNGRFVIGYDGKVTPSVFAIDLEEAMSEIMDSDAGPEDEIYGRIQFKISDDLVGDIWTDRPKVKASEIYELPISSAGLSATEKIKNARESMLDAGADYILLSDLMETAWLFNLRGSDVENTPVFYAYTLIGKDSVALYLPEEAKVPDSFSDAFVKPYESVYKDLAELPRGSKLWLDTKSTNYALYTSPQEAVDIYDAMTPPGEAKQVKNDTEIKSTKNAHIKDAVAVTRFIKWIKESVYEEDVQTEISAADYIESMRAEQDGFIGLSFTTIAAYGANGAIVHYEPTPETNAEIRPEGFLLVDSGGQYIDGTTDVTRTIAMGPLTQEMIDDYTYVLKSHIAFAKLKYKPGMSGKETDDILRMPMRDAGLGFKHGIGHGVGHVLCVHEDAAVIRDFNRGNAGIKAGMIMSDEPGYYREGEFGIRIENLILFKDDGSGCIINEPITLVPYEREAINKSLLSTSEIKWIDNYHKTVRKTLTPLLDKETADWLHEQTRPL